MNVIVPHGFETNYTAGFTAGLAACGVDFVVISCDADDRLLAARGIRTMNLRGSITEDRRPIGKAANLLRYYLRLLGFLVAHRGGTLHFTGIFRNDLLLFEGVVLPAMFRLLSRRYLYTAHNVLPHDRGKRVLHRFVYRWIYRLPDTIVVHTALAGERIAEEFGVPRERIRISSIGVNEEVPVTGLGRPEARERLGLPPAAKVLLFFGKIGEYKGLDLLIDAHERLAHAGLQLLVAGSFSDEGYRSRIHARIAASTQRERIRLHEGHVPNEEVEPFFAAADALVLPYREISQSGLLFLAMRFGVPVVATDVGSMKAWLEPELGLVATTNDASGIAAALERFLAAPDRFDPQRILARGRECRWDDVCRALRPLYE